MVQAIAYVIKFIVIKCAPLASVVSGFPVTCKEWILILTPQNTVEVTLPLLTELLLKQCLSQQNQGHRISSCNYTPHKQ